MIFNPVIIGLHIDHISCRTQDDKKKCSRQDFHRYGDAFVLMISIILICPFLRHVMYLHLPGYSLSHIFDLILV